MKLIRQSKTKFRMIVCIPLVCIVAGSEAAAIPGLLGKLLGDVVRSGASGKRSEQEQTSASGEDRQANARAGQTSIFSSRLDNFVDAVFERVKNKKSKSADKQNPHLKKYLQVKEANNKKYDKLDAQGMPDRRGSKVSGSASRLPNPPAPAQIDSETPSSSTPAAKTDSPPAAPPGAAPAVKPGLPEVNVKPLNPDGTPVAGADGLPPIKINSPPLGRQEAVADKAASIPPLPPEPSGARPSTTTLSK